MSLLKDYPAKPGTVFVYSFIGEPYRENGLWKLKMLVSKDQGRTKSEETFSFDSRESANLYIQKINDMPKDVQDTITELEFDLAVFREMVETGEYYHMLLMSEDEEGDDEDDTPDLFAGFETPRVLN